MSIAAVEGWTIHSKFMTSTQIQVRKKVVVEVGLYHMIDMKIADIHNTTFISLKEILLSTGQLSGRGQFLDEQKLILPVSTL